jgi:hypothetical protein
MRFLREKGACEEIGFFGPCEIPRKTPCDPLEKIAKSRKTPVNRAFFDGVENDFLTGRSRMHPA